MRNINFELSHIVRAHCKMLGLAIAVLITAVGATAIAQDGWRENGKSIGGDPSKASAQGFAIMQISTLDPNGFAASWNKPGAGVALAKTSSVVRNQPVVTFIIFTGCAADGSGNCNVTADFKMFDPTGKPFGDQLGSKVWVGMPPPPTHQLQLSASALGMIVENKDSLGNYRIVATVTDHVSGISLTTEQTIIAKAAS